jgi:hypothetical protein
MVCDQFAKLSSQYGMHQGQVIPGEENLNGIDMAWKQLKSLFKPKKRAEAVPLDGAAAYSAIPARLNASSKGTSSAPSSPGGRRKAEPEMMRSPSAPNPELNYEPPGGATETTPFIFALANPLLQLYAPSVLPQVERAQRWYEQFRDGDQKSFWLTHAFLFLVLLYLLSAMLLFTFKLIVFTVVMYSTGWTVYTSELFNHNEAVKKYAYIATALIGLYLFALMN